MHSRAKKPSVPSPPLSPACRSSATMSQPWRKSHIEVCARVRPLLVDTNVSSSSFFTEKASNARQLRPPTSLLPRGPPRRPPKRLSPEIEQIPAWNVMGKDQISQSSETDIIAGRTFAYTLDRVFGSDSSTRQVYEESVMDLCHAAMDGYHTSIIAYGQTGSGKTYTMTGTKNHAGLVPSCIEECFRYLQNDEQPREYLLRVSYLEVYKEHVRDLLATSAAAPPVRLFDSAEGLIIRNLQEPVVTNPEQVFEILRDGESRRQMGATHMNQHSSRSHVIVRVLIESRHIHNNTVRTSSLSLVDLAGSESVKLSGSNDRREEGHFINQSLMTLGKVVYALSEEEKAGNTKRHIPYRDSKLTRLLQPSLSGNAQVVIIVCISPAVTCIEESHNTLKFAIRAKKIPQKATIQEGNDERTLLQSYRQEIEELRQQLREARQNQEQLVNGSRHTNNSVDSSLDMEADTEVSELVKAIQTMEKLILKSKPAQPEDLLDQTDNMEDDTDADLMGLISGAQQPSTPLSRTSSSLHQDTSDDLQRELARMRGLLSSVLKKRTTTPTRISEEELIHLKKQLEKQEETSHLRQADSSFLQKQLEEKDNLLVEISKVLESAEATVQVLERENATLRNRVNELEKRTESAFVTL